MNTIFTTADKNVTSLLIDFCVSLRTLGQFKDRVVVMDYGIPTEHKENLKEYQIEFLKRQKTNSILQQRFIDAIPFLVKNEGNFAHFDCDIWFQDNVNGCFDRIPQDGLLYAADVGWFTQGWDRIGSETDYNLKVKRLKQKHNGTVQGGFVCGKKKELLDRFIEFSECVHQNGLRYDQFITNYLFDEEKDDLTGYLYNSIGTDTYCKNGFWYTTKSGYEEKVIGCHVVGMYRSEKNRLFNNPFNKKPNIQSSSEHEKHKSIILNDRTNMANYSNAFRQRKYL